MDFTKPSKIEQYNKTIHDLVLLLQRCHNLQGKTPNSQEMLAFGFSRRLGILKFCLEEFVKICPLEQNLIIDKNNAAQFLTVLFQAHIFNVYGALDNLAAFYSKTLKLELDKHDISIFKITKEKKNKPILFDFIPEDIQNYIIKIKKDWFDNYLKEYRDALSHRIPIYVPRSLKKEDKEKADLLEKEKWDTLKKLASDPDNKRLSSDFDKLRSEQDKLLHIEPSPYREQMIVDILTVTDLSNKIFDHIDILLSKQPCQ